jgi:hypothetical protein
MFPTTVLRVLVSWLRRGLHALRWLRDRARRSLQQLRSPGLQKTDVWNPWYNDLYRSLGERAPQSGQPGEPLRS